MQLDLSRMGFGVTGALDHDIVRELAPRLEEAGFRTLWFNHAGTGNALESMRVAADVTSTLRLGSGVIPVDRVPPQDIVTQFQELGLPRDRVVLGIGASAPPSPLTTISEATATLSSELGVPVMFGALGPKMRRAGVRDADGVLLNWLTPDAAGQAMADRDRDLEDMPGKQSEVALYIRCAVDTDAHENLRREAERYEGIPSYAANFRRLGFRALDSAVMVTSSEEMVAELRPFLDVVDEPVIRAITATESLDAYLALVDAVS
jgi:alkanesulfonate monooxygenase SsuD/methylene tetrahydromethanopterin reductase-like flavin-dependent oxidoreductase (luciferase family)